MLDLKGFVQHYDWGGKNFIPDLIGVENPANLPFAELWLGTHPKGPSLVTDGTTTMNLATLLDANPALLGSGIRERFDSTLPFLLKVLDVRDMLSIQAHPDKTAAQAGFAAEEAAGIPLEARERVFKDPNDKPEMMLALTDFWLLHGFKSVPEITQSLSATPELIPLLEVFADIKTLYTHIMTLPQDAVNNFLFPLKQRLLDSNLTDKSSPEFWAKRALQTFHNYNGDIDRGICSIFLMNIVYLQPGEAIFQDAGILHAYLEGVNVELMGNSDNVFRGGLTSKHIDVPALLTHISYEHVEPNIHKGWKKDQVETAFPSPFPAFALSVLQPDPDTTWNHHNPDSLEIYLVLKGSVTANGKNKQKGAAFALEANQPLTLKASANAPKAFLVRASVGNNI